MNRRRGLVLVVLLYVTLDLSVPTIPGVFVFESSDSVEFGSGRAGQGKAEMSVRPALARDAVVVSQPSHALRDRVPPNGNVGVLDRRMLTRLPRATLDPAPPSEDPH